MHLQASLDLLRSDPEKISSYFADVNKSLR